MIGKKLTMERVSENITSTSKQARPDGTLPCTCTPIHILYIHDYLHTHKYKMYIFLTLSNG